MKLSHALKKKVQINKVNHSSNGYMNTSDRKGIWIH